MKGGPRADTFVRNRRHWRRCACDPMHRIRLLLWKLATIIADGSTAVNAKQTFCNAVLPGRKSSGQPSGCDESADRTWRGHPEIMRTTETIKRQDRSVFRRQLPNVPAQFRIIRRSALYGNMFVAAGFKYGKGVISYGYLIPLE